MSDFIRRLNIIKRKREFTWLTPSQREAFDTVKEILRAPGTVNLFGATGVGKTFLAWTLAEELNYQYLSHPGKFERHDNADFVGVILDNSSFSRMEHRQLLKELHFRKVDRAVLVTRHLIHDYTRYVEVKLSVADQLKVKENLAGSGLTFGAGRQVGNLWFLINPYL